MKKFAVLEDGAFVLLFHPHPARFDSSSPHPLEFAIQGIHTYTYFIYLESKGLFTWSGGPRPSGVGFFCFYALGDTKQKKPTPLDRGPPLHVNRVLYNK